MKKFLMPLLVLLLVGGGVALYVVNHRDAGELTTTTEGVRHEEVGEIKKACDLFTSADAAAILGQPVQSGSTDNTTTSDTATVSTCTYINNGATVSDIVTATLLVRYAASEAETKQGFDTGKESLSSAEAVQDLGEEAYYSPLTKQLNIRQGHYWFIISAGTADEANREAIDKIAQNILGEI